MPSAKVREMTDDGSVLLQRQAEFRIGDAYPADDPVARFLTALAMASNDVLRLLRWMRDTQGAGDEEKAVRLLSLRMQASALFEVSEYVVRCRRTWQEVSGFLSELGPDAAGYLDHVVGATTPGHGRYMGWLEAHRNVTFHYPRLQREAAVHDAEEMQNALRSAADLSSTIVEPGPPLELRYHYADEVGVQLLPDLAVDPEHLARLRDLAIATVLFVRDAHALYLSRLPSDRVTVTRG